MRGIIVCLSGMLAVQAQAVGLLDEIAAVDEKADAVVAAIKSADELKAKQDEWRAAWLKGIGGLHERTPLNAKEGPIVKCDGFTLQNILFESQPGVYVVGHLALPDSPAFKPSYPAVLMPMGHSDNGILAPRYAAHLAMMARAGFAAFSWDPISQGERRQCPKEKDAGFKECACEHTRLGAHGWLVGWNFARFRIWDGMRALDYLETRKDVDCSKVGVCGTSGGGTMSAYLQALDPRIKVAFPNCYISSIREVFRERGCHDAEQFYFNQLNDGVNHAAMLAMGYPRVALATGSRWADYFPHAGAVSTFAVYTNLVDAESFPRQTRKLLSAVDLDLQPRPFSPWHFHCAGPHGLPLPTRQAQVDWMVRCIKGGPAPKKLDYYWSLSTGDHSGTNDPSSLVELPFPKDAAYFTPTHQVRDLPGFKSVYSLIGERAVELKKAHKPKTREELRGIVRRRAGIRPLEKLLEEEHEPRTTNHDSRITPFDHPNFNWWYLKGAYGVKRENEAAILSTLGRSVVGRDAERIILKAIAEIVRQHPEVTLDQLLNSSVQPSTFNLQPAVPLKANGPDCIAAAHAYAAEPQLFSKVELTNRPPSWFRMATDHATIGDESFALIVWSALEEYDWTDLVP